MESTECIAAQAIAAWSLSTSAACVRATLSRANASTPAGVSRSVAVVVMGLLNQAPPTVLIARISLVHKGDSDFGKSFGEVSIRSLALATRPPKPALSPTIQHARHNVRRWFRWSSREGALAPDRIETSPA